MAGMSTLQIVIQLLLKRAEIEAQIDSLNDRLSEARADLLHVVAVVRLYDPAAAEGRPAGAYHGATKATKRSDPFTLCKAALESPAEPLDTRQIARHVITAEGWDTDDRRLAIAIGHKVGAMMGRLEARGAVRKAGTRDRAALWRLS